MNAFYLLFAAFAANIGMIATNDDSDKPSGKTVAETANSGQASAPVRAREVSAPPPEDPPQQVEEPAKQPVDKGMDGGMDMDDHAGGHQGHDMPDMVETPVEAPVKTPDINVSDPHQGHDMPVVVETPVSQPVQKDVSDSHDDHQGMDHQDGHQDHGGHDHGPTVELPTTSAEIDAFVAAVKASPEHHHHGDHAGKMAEHMAAMALTDKSDATHIAIRDGDWNDPQTWYQGKIPDDDARVLIPEGITLSYGEVNDARLFTLRVDGKLDFATDADSKLLVDTFVVSPTGTLTIGTATDPVQADVDVDIIFANNGAIDTDWDPTLLSRGMIAHGKVEIHGTEKDSHEKVVDDPMAGDTSVRFDGIPEGWAVGDTIIIAGTEYEGYYNTLAEYGYSPSEDEERVISEIKGNRVFFEDPLVHDHDTPRADLHTSVANYTRNVSFETENAAEAEVHERAHIMFMHNDDVDVRYAEFHELGRTDKSEEARNVGEFDSIASDSNVKGRYAVHLHRAGTEDQDDPAILEGNAVYGSPGWGYVHHDSNAILENNASFNTFGAGYVAESGNETGAWHDNIAILAQGISWQNPKLTSDIPNFDLATGGDGFWFQSRTVESTDNVAASVNNGFVYFHRGPYEDSGQLRLDSDVSPIADALYFDPAIRPDQHPILSFSGNEAFAANTGLYVLKSFWVQNHDVYTVLDDFTAWEVKTGADLSYTGHYVLKDFDLISRDDPELGNHPEEGTGILYGRNLVNMTIKDSTIEGFETGIDLNKEFVGEKVSEELHEFAVINPTFIDVDTEFANLDPRLDMILATNELLDVAPDVKLTSDLYFSHGSTVEITGTKLDSLGTTDFPAGPEDYSLNVKDVHHMILENGYYTTSDGQDYFLLDILFSDRATGDIYKEIHPVLMDEDTVQLRPNHPVYKDFVHNGTMDLDSPENPATDVASLWATLTDGQLVLAEELPLADEELEPGLSLDDGF